MADPRRMSLGDYVIAVIFGAVILVVGAGVFWRYVLGDPLVWTVELSRILFTWMIFLGAALAVKEGTHIRVDLFTDRLPARLKRCLAVGVFALMAVFLGVMVWLGLQYAHGESESLTPALGLRQAYVWYAALPVGMALGAYFAARKAFEAWRSPTADESMSKDRS